MNAKSPKKTDIKKLVFTLIPFLLFSIGISLLSVFFFREYVESSNLWKFIVNTDGGNTDTEGNETTSSGEVIENSMADISIAPIVKPENSQDNQESTEPDTSADPEQIYYDKKDFPGYKWGSLCGTLSAPSMGIEDIKIYVGESNAIYKKGIGKRFGTRFPGQGGNIVLSAHVTREFYHLQDMKIGDKIYIEMGYGSYVYEVYETFIFSINDEQYVMNYDDGEKLTLYTCHPRGSAYRTERYGVLCKKISGPEWIKID